MIVANFTANDSVKYIKGLYQYDRGQVLQITGLNLPQVVEIDFALEETGSVAERKIGTTENGITEVEIPNHLLVNNDIGDDYPIYAFVYVTDKEVGKTVKVIRLQVKSRSKPEKMETPEDKDLFQEVINSVSGYAKESKRWAVGDANVPESVNNNAKYYSEEAKKVENSIKTEGGKFLTGITEENKKAESNIESLSANIRTAGSTGKILTKQTTQAKEANTILSGTIQEANESKTALAETVTIAGTAKSELLQKISDAENATSNATIAKTNLDKAGEEAKKVEEAVNTAKQNAENAKNVLEGTITKSGESKTALEETMTASGTAIEKVNEAIKNAGVAKDEANSATLETNKATETANTTKTELGNSTLKASELKDALDKSIGEVAQEATGAQILTVLQKGSDLLGQIAKIVEETAGKAGSLNGFGLNLLADGSVSLTYTNPDTNLLEASAIFPKDSTAKKLDQALGEMNNSLKIIALREGGKA